jgi:outer membrane lipoprotein SlyB
MDRNDESILRSLIAGGVVGAVLGALISKNGRKGASIGALAGAVILATYKAFQQAQKTNIGVCIEEDNKLFEILPGGNRRFIKDIPKPNVPASNSFKLK